jgi:hypothetical protein
MTDNIDCFDRRLAGVCWWGMHSDKHSEVSGAGPQPSGTATEYSTSTEQFTAIASSTLCVGATCKVTFIGSTSDRVLRLKLFLICAQ